MNYNDKQWSIYHGKKITLEVFGASHSPEIGVKVNGLEGETADFELLEKFMERRRAKKSAYSTKRIEGDKVQIESGFDGEKFVGETFKAVIKNNAQRSQDYEDMVKIPRPSHADFVAWSKYGNGFDYRGGGKFSGRLTAPICIAGGICKQLLEKKGINVNAYISSIGKNVNWIGDFSFSGCNSLESIIISDSVTEIGSYAFEMCSSLINIEIPDSVETINSCAFYYCISLKSITIPNNVTRIGENAFWCCESLTSITIPDSVKNIHNYTFFGCNSLTSITISNSVRNFGDHSFDGCSSLKEVYYTGTEKQWNIINIGTNNEYLTNATIHFEKEDINYTKELIYELSSDKTYYSVTDIGTLTDSNIIIPDTYNGLPVKKIEFEAFGYCSWLTSVTIGNNVTSIESYAFIGCSSLTNVTIGINVNWIWVGDYAFSGCSSLTSITIPDSVSVIGSYTFEMCSLLTSITIPNSVTSIGDCTFYECSSLTDIYYSGTKEQWNSINIGTGNESLSNATIHYNYSK